MTKWLAAVAAPVVAALVTAFLTDWFGLGDGPTSGDRSTPVTVPTRAVARVTAFNQFGNRSGQSPTAKITVENQGANTAANCVVSWESGIGGDVPETQSSQEFALRANQSTTVEFSSSYSWPTSEVTVTTASAWVVCSNTRSPKRSKLVFVF